MSLFQDKKILIVEPHADDACLSGHFTIKQLAQENKIYISTVSISNVSNTFRSSQAYCEDNGYTSFSLDYCPQIFFKQGLKLLEFNNYKISKELIYSHKQVFNIFYEAYTDIYWHIQEILDEIINTIQPDILITCYGILHSTHVFTKQAVSCFQQPVYYLIDNPYYNLITLENNYQIVNTISMNNSLVNEKREIFAKYYPTEVYMESMYDNMYGQDEILVQEGN